MDASLLRRGILSVMQLIRPFLTDESRDAIASLVAPVLRSRVVTYRNLATRSDVRTWWFDNERIYEFSQPDFFNELPPEIERLIGTHTCEAPFVMEVPDVVVKGSPGHLITGDGKYIKFDFWRESETLAPARGLAHDFMYSVGQGRLPRISVDTNVVSRKLDTGVSLRSKHATNYTHWIQDCLTLLQGVDEYVERTGQEPVLIIPPDPPAFVTESLELFGYPEDTWIEWEDELIGIDHLILPSMRRCLSSTSNDYFRMISGLEWVRNRALDRVKSDSDRRFASKVLISREDATTRRMINREEVITELEPLGFEPYVLSEMGFADQVRLFSQADFIVGAHGAGMINCIYATGANILELYGDHFLPANFELAQGLGNRYGCLRCAPMGDDLVVDFEELRDAINALK